MLKSSILVTSLLGRNLDIEQTCDEYQWDSPCLFDCANVVTRLGHNYLHHSQGEPDISFEWTRVCQWRAVCISLGDEISQW